VRILIFKLLIMSAMLLSGCVDLRDFYGDGSSHVNVPIQVVLPSAVSDAAYRTQPDYRLEAESAHFFSSDLPEWLTLNKESGEISGLAKSIESSISFNVEADISGKRSEYELSLVVEPASKYRYSENNDFYDKDYDGNARHYRNDLIGSFAAEVQFVQSHSVAPNNNFQQNKLDETQSRYMPRPVALRDALVVAIPLNEITNDVLYIEVLQNGSVVSKQQMHRPGTLPKADYANGQKLSYSNKAWWVPVPWDQMKNGLELRFSTRLSEGVLPAADIDIGLATQLVFQTIRLGMLSEPPAVSDSQYVSNDPIAAAADYFQTLPVSRLVMANYADAKLDKVMVRSGKIYDTVSDTRGDVYSGDMRGDVAKSQVSVGINMANYGVTSHDMNQSYLHVFKQITNHHARGNYSNGFINHGLSGGNGIGTLYSSSGNEASHEWGHAFGMGHYPGQGLTTDGRWAVHHADSGWGYIAHRNRMRANISGVLDEGGYNFHRDSMSGGSENSLMSRYTFYTGFTARHIQSNLERFPIPDINYASGYKRWNTDIGDFENAEVSALAPVAVGVPVATLLGAHNPDGDTAVLYPVFHGNYGNVFDLPSPNLNNAEDQCWVEVRNRNNERKMISVASARHRQDSANQLHFNLPAAFKPTLAVLSCQREGQVSEVTRMAFDGEIPALPPVAIIGQEAGYQQLLDREVSEIETSIVELPIEAQQLPIDVKLKVESQHIDSLLNKLSFEARGRLESILTLEKAADSVQVLLRHAQSQNLSSLEIAERLELHLSATGLASGDIEDVPTALINGNGYYFDVSDDSQPMVLLTEDEAIAAEQGTQWVMDRIGRLHLKDAIALCMQPAGNGRLNVADCDVSNLGQRWVYNPEIGQLKNVASAKCLDFDRANVALITYGCSGAWNQNWQGVVQYNEPWLVLLDNTSLKAAWALLATGDI
jgi:hypothetical protein